MSHTHLSPTDPDQVYALATELDRDIRKKRPISPGVAKTCLEGIARAQWSHNAAADMHRAAHRIATKAGITFTTVDRAEILKEAQRGNSTHAFRKIFT